MGLDELDGDPVRPQTVRVALVTFAAEDERFDAFFVTAVRRDADVDHHTVAGLQLAVRDQTRALLTHVVADGEVRAFPFDPRRQP